MNISTPKFLDYSAVLDFLYIQLPMFQRVGGAAYKKDLANTIRLCEALGNPQNQFKSVHVGGTNGKGSCSHYIASILQSAGYKTGLYTSPHLKNFTERIKRNGREMPQQAVIDFVNRHKALIEEVQPSFFEITVAMAFEYFVEENVDIAVVEVGMGGRLDSTNVVMPEVSLITNISKDHEQWLGTGLATIAGEKAGIIKNNIPVVISERQAEVSPVFDKMAAERKAPIIYAEDHYTCIRQENFVVYKTGMEYASFPSGLFASYQEKNVPAVLTVIDQLKQLGYNIEQSHIKEGLSKMVEQTGLKGRWQLLQEHPRMICDVGHNEAGVQLIVDQLNQESYGQLHIVWGTVNDKDISNILLRLPQKAQYYFCQADIPRALAVGDLAQKAKNAGLTGQSYKSVKEAVDNALQQAKPEDLIFVGGSTFVVAELEQL